jgi:DNA-binding response OmpR family regulator
LEADHHIVEWFCDSDEAHSAIRTLDYACCATFICNCPMATDCHFLCVRDRQNPETPIIIPTARDKVLSDRIDGLNRGQTMRDRNL